MNITVPLKTSPSREAAFAYLAKLQLTGRTTPARVSRPIKWVRLAPRLASEIADLPALTVSRR